jgi:hypothetical protein
MVELDGGHGRRIMATWGTSRKLNFARYPVDFGIVISYPVETDIDIACDIQDQQMSHLRMTIDIQSGRDVVCYSSIFVLGTVSVHGFPHKRKFFDWYLLTFHKGSVDSSVSTSTIEKSFYMERLVIFCH